MSDISNLNVNMDIKDESGVPHGIKISNGAIFVISEQTLLEIPAGNIPNTTSVNKFGDNEVSAIDTDMEVWGGSAVYSYPTTADITHIMTDISDIPMQGAIISIQGLDINYNLTTQTVILATPTTTAVALTTPLIRVFRMEVLANIKNLQAIYLKNTAGTTVYAQIDINRNQSLMAIYTVPAGKTAYITKYYGDVVEDVQTGQDPDVTEFKLCSADRANNYEFQIKHERAIPKGQSGFEHYFKPYYKFTEKTDIVITTKCSGKAGHVHAGFDLILRDN